jgi:hypothetical protein
MRLSVRIPPFFPSGFFSRKRHSLPQNAVTVPVAACVAPRFGFLVRQAGYPLTELRKKRQPPFFPRRQGFILTAYRIQFASHEGCHCYKNNALYGYRLPVRQVQARLILLW